MKKICLFFVLLIMLAASSCFIISAAAQSGPYAPPVDLSAPPPVIPSAEVTLPPPPSPEASSEVKPVSVEAAVIPSGEVSKWTTPEAAPTPESLALPPIPTEEGSTYKGVPWGWDFKRFKQIKGYTGSLASPSAGFINSTGDNDIALLLNVPASPSGDNHEQRVMFEYVPQKFASVYFQPDDVYYIFYDGNFSLVFSNLIARNFDLYRDNFYKKYTYVGLITKQYAPSNNRKYRVDALQFAKGQTLAFLIKSQDTVNKKTVLSTKMVLFSSDAYDAIKQEIKDKISSEDQVKNLKLENDLKKIE